MDDAADRELAIADNVAYAARVHAAVGSTLPTCAPLVVVGFSQGAAQAYRAGLALGAACHGIVVLGGDLPPDVAAHAGRLPPVLVGRGRTDSWYPAERFAADVAALQGAGCRVESRESDGAREWAEAFVADVRVWLDARRAG